MTVTQTQLYKQVLFQQIIQTPQDKERKMNTNYLFHKKDGKRTPITQSCTLYKQQTTGWREGRIEVQNTCTFGTTINKFTNTCVKTKTKTYDYNLTQCNQTSFMLRFKISRHMTISMANKISNLSQAELSIWKIFVSFALIFPHENMDYIHPQ